MIERHCVMFIAPNKDSPAFFDALTQNLADSNEQKIIVGDFNLVLDVNVDRYGSNHNNWRACAVIKEMMEEYCLNDVWRSRNEGELRFSWQRNVGSKNYQASRIDFALISRGLDTRIGLVSYLQGILTDHCALYLCVESQHKNDRGSGYWKMNVSKLRNKQIVDYINYELEKDIEVSKDMEACTRWEFIKKNLAKALKHVTKQSASEEKGSDLPAL